MQMIAHGFVSAPCSCASACFMTACHSREIAAYGGVVNTMPKFHAFALLFAMANCGLPGTAGFVGEWMVILGARSRPTSGSTFAAATALIFGAAYTLWMLQARVPWSGPMTTSGLDGHRQPRVLVLAALASPCSPWAYPRPFTDVMDVSGG